MPSATVDDDEVVAALQSGDEAAFAAVTERYKATAGVVQGWFCAEV